MVYDSIIIGGGIVGVSTALQLKQRMPQARILLLEKESGFARHQTGHNSGVIHAGVYYTPGSLKADFCRRGVQATIAFCRQESIGFEQCGKLLVATDTLEQQRMQALFGRCRKNGIEAHLLSASELQARAPDIAGLGAIFVPDTGIVDYREVTKAMAAKFYDLGGEIRLKALVRDVEERSDSITAETSCGDFTGKNLITCAGLMADRMIRKLGIKTDFQIIPFRGEYFRLPPDKNRIINHLIYPIPDPELPFLGVHLTRMIDGSVTVGPNAVLGLAREGYRKSQISFRDLGQMAGFAGFWKLLARHRRSATAEMVDSLSKTAYLRRVQKYCPQLTKDDLLPHPAGIRAQAVRCDGSLVHDFLFAESNRSIHVANAPSPAATSAIPIGQHIAEKIVSRFYTG